MNSQEQYKRLIRTLFCCVLLCIYEAFFWYIWRSYYSPLMEKAYWRRGHWLILAVYFFWVFWLPRVYGGWKVGYLRVFNIIYSQGLGLLLADGLMYVLIVLLTKHFVNPLPLLEMYVGQFACTIPWGIITNRLYLTAYPPLSFLLVYGEHPAAGLVNRLRTRTDRFEVERIIHISEGIEKIEQELEQYQGLVICDIPSQERNRLLKYCYGKGIRTYTTPKISDLLIRSAESQHMFDTPLLLFRNNGLLIEQRIAKRITDIVIALLALIPAIPIMIVVALCIKLEDGGAVIYRQNRLTQDGREFDIYKFRSMREDAEKDGVARLAQEKDDRITKVGAVIRMLRFDELPQIFNILKGDMSVVGPRPERPEIAREYEESIPEFRYRLKVKAGLTGYAQVYGKYNMTAYDKLKLDLMYIQNYSVRLDFEIMLKTVQILFMKESTEGVQPGQEIALTDQRKRKTETKISADGRKQDGR